MIPSPFLGSAIRKVAMGLVVIGVFGVATVYAANPPFPYGMRGVNSTDQNLKKTESYNLGPGACYDPQDVSTCNEIISEQHLDIVQDERMNILRLQISWCHHLVSGHKFTNPAQMALFPHGRALSSWVDIDKDPGTKMVNCRAATETGLNDLKTAEHSIIDPRFFNVVRTLVEKANAHGMHVVIGFTSFNEMLKYDVAVNGSPEDISARAVKIETLKERWREITGALNSFTPEQMSFEIMNEPYISHNGKVDETAGEAWNVIQNDLLINVIRNSGGNNTNRYVVMNGIEYGGRNALAFLSLPASDPKLAVSFHYYEPFGVTAPGALWMDTVWTCGLVGRTWTEEQISLFSPPGSPTTEKQMLESHFAGIASIAASRFPNAPLLVGEFGTYIGRKCTCDEAYKGKSDKIALCKAGDPTAPLKESDPDHANARLRWTGAVRRIIEKHGMAWTYFDLQSQSFGTIDAYNQGYGDTIRRVLRLTDLALIGDRAIRTSPTSPTANRPFSVYANVKNQGQTPSPVFHTSLRIDQGADGTWDFAGVESVTRPIAAGRTTPIKFRKIFTPKEAGAYRIEVCANDGSFSDANLILSPIPEYEVGIAETDYTNNCQSMVVNVKPARGGGAAAAAGALAAFSLLVGVPMGLYYLSRQRERVVA